MLSASGNFSIVFIICDLYKPTDFNQLSQLAVWHRNKHSRDMEPLSAHSAADSMKHWQNRSMLSTRAQDAPLGKVCPAALGVGGGATA